MICRLLGLKIIRVPGLTFSVDCLMVGSAIPVCVLAYEVQSDTLRYR